MDFFDTVLWPIMVGVAWVMVTLHKLFVSAGLDPSGGASWTLSIIGLVLVIRILLIPLFFRQIHASRGLQVIQPELQELQKKYKGKSDPASREAMAREQMELYRKHGTNPFSSCLPILAQSPVFFALFRVLNSLAMLADGTYAHGARVSIGPLTRDLAAQAESATLFGAPLSGTFMHSTNTATKVLTIVLILAMSASQFFMQRQLMRKNMPPSALEGPMAQQQKMMLYVLPIVFGVTGVNFPIGVLVYWTVSNVWTVGQQFYTIRRMPTPGSEAEAAMRERQARKAARRGLTDEPVAAIIEETPKKGGQRQQPKRKDRAKKSPARPAAPEPEQTVTPVAPVEVAPGSDALDEDAKTSSGSRQDGPRKPRKPRSGNSSTKSRQGGRADGPEI